MNITNETCYLYYILEFIDNKTRIYQSIDQTLCSQSIQGANPDAFHQVHDGLYQFFATRTHCIIKPLENAQDNFIEETQWIQPFIQLYLTSIYNYQINRNHNLSNERNEDEEKQIMFYLRKINLKMKLELFDKIKENSHYYKKIYSKEEIFFICDSYAFSLLDNRLILLKNIIYLMLQELWDLNDIYYVFFNHASKNYENSEYFQKLNYELSKVEQIDLHQIIYQFIMENQKFTTTDHFLNDLYHWNLKIMNMISLMQQLFCFRIMKDKDDAIMEICTSLECKSTYDVLIYDFELFSFFITEDCIISCKYFSCEIYKLFSLIFDARKDVKIQINITEFYLNLEISDTQELICKSIELENFLSFLSKRINEFITLIIYSNKFHLNKNNGYFEFLKLNEQTSLNIDKSLLISANIIMNLSEIENLLKNIANLIISYNFVKEFQNNMDLIFISQNYDIPKFIYLNMTSNKHFLISSYFQNQAIGTTIKGLIESITIDGTKYKEYAMICVDKCDQIYKNIEFLAGIIDNNVSLFVINSPTNQFSDSSDFVSKWSISCKNEFNNTVNEIFDQKSQLFNCNLQEKECLIYHVNLRHYTERPTELICSLVGSFKKIQNCPDCLQKISLAFFTQNTTDYNKILKSYYGKNKLENCASTIMNCSATTSRIFQKYRETYFYLKIKHSNFHLSIFRCIECKSINPNMSSLSKKGRNFYKLRANFCYIKFLSTNFHLVDFIVLKNCKLEVNFRLFLNKSSNALPLRMKFINFELLSPMILFDFAKIEPMNNKSEFYSFQNEHDHELKLKNCKIFIFANLSQYISDLEFSQCEIVILNDLFASNQEYSTNQSKQNEKLTNIIEKNKIKVFNTDLYLKIEQSRLPDNLEITGILDAISIINCVSMSLCISISYRTLDIQNHHGNFLVSSIPIKAVSLGEYCCLRVCNYKTAIILENLKIDNISDIEIDEIQIQKCQIDKIDNVVSRIIGIQDSKCSFQIKNENKIVKYSGLIQYFSVSKKPLYIEVPFQPFEWKKYKLMKINQ